MTIAVDSSSPAIAHGAQLSSTITCAAFSPPIRSLLVAMAPCNSSTSGTTTSTITDNKGLTWSQIGVANFTNTGGNGYAAIYATYLTAAQTSMTVTIDTLGSTSTTRRPTLKVFVLTGAHRDELFDVVTIATNATNDFNGTFTQAIANSMLMINACEWNKRGVPTSSNLSGEFFDQPLTGGVSGICGYRVLDATPGSEGFNLNEFGTSAPRWTYVVTELAPAVVPTISAGADDTDHTTNVLFTTTATETSDGGNLITTRAWTIVSGPQGAGSTIGTAAALSWTPTLAGTYVLRYSATNDIGTTTDDMSLTVEDPPPPVGEYFMQNILPDNSRLAIEIAWGADLTAASSTWTWTDITTDVRTDQGINTKIGRGDEASVSQPARLNIVLDNRESQYTLGPQSPNWPDVRKNTPIRVSVSLDELVYITIFFGYIVSLQPDWNLRGNESTASLVAAGALRRIIQGSTPLLSPLRRAIPLQTNVIAYWPLEDNKNAETFSAVIGAENMNFVGGPPDIGGNTAVDASDAIPILKLSEFRGNVPVYTYTGSNEIRVLFDFPFPSDYATNTVLFSVYTTGTVARWDVFYRGNDAVAPNNTGGFQLKAYNRFNVELYASAGYTFGVDGQSRYYSLQLVQDGADVDWVMRTTRPYTSLGAVSGTATGVTVGNVTSISINREKTLDDIGCGHISVQNSATALADLQLELDAYAGEYTILSSTTENRLDRLCDENDIVLTKEADPIGASIVTDRMGPQGINSIDKLLREAEFANQGILYDGLSQGLNYITRFTIESAPSADLTIDASSFELSAPFTPIDDDQTLRNSIEVRRYTGASFTLSDEDGELGINTVGRYDTSVEVNTYLDSALQFFAGWFLSRGTVVGYRYPNITIDLGANPHLAADVFALRPGYRVDITNPGVVLPGLPNEDISVLIEGISHKITNRTWVTELVCSPYGMWRIGVLTDTASSTDDYEMHLETDDSVLAANVAAGATSISVTTNSGPLWSTTSTDYPFDLSIGDRKVEVTACSDATSPQTMTVNPLTESLTAGMEVKLWRPTVLGL